MTTDPKVQRIIEWRETFETLSDDYFFEIIRMYLGEVKTPYNKHDLIDELSGFLRKEENRQNIIKLLGEDDLKIISAVKFMPSSTQEKLSKFFASTFSVAIFYERLENLQERLILFTKKDKISNTEVIAINPMLEDVLAPFLNSSILLPENELTEVYESTVRTISPDFIASFIAFVIARNDLCKGDGTFKKKTLNDIAAIYGTDGKELQLLMKAFFNLNLMHHDDKCVSVDWQRMAQFAFLSPAFQYVYITVAASIHLSRKTLQTNAQLLLDVLCSISKKGFTREEILRLSLMLKERNGGDESFAQSRFSRILARSESEDKDSFGDGGISDGSLTDSFIDSALSFGLLYMAGKNSSNEEVYAVSPAFEEALNARPLQVKPKVISIDSGFSITLMPGLPLKDLLALVKFLEPVHFDTVAVYEINRRSVMSCFDTGVLPAEIFETLKLYALYEIPQNLQVSVEEWYHSYSSATLYHGYVLRVSDDNAVFAQKNPVLSRYIKEVLAPGIFLLNFHSDEEAETIISKSGLDFIGEVRTAENEEQTIPLPPLRKSSGSALSTDAAAVESKFERGTFEQQKNLAASFRKQLEKIDATVDQKEGLADRISRKIIVNENQLRPSSVKFERLEALGIDYNGKLHVIENALSTGGMLEIETEDAEELLIGTPLFLDKKTANAEVVIDLEPEHLHKVVSVSAAVRIKKIRTRHIKDL